jgi:DNA processing protein
VTTGVGGRAIGVLGTGIDVCYAKENKKPFERTCAAKGAIISELPTGSHPAQGNFPTPNRIIAGMPLEVVIAGGQPIERVIDHRQAGDGVWALGFRVPGKREEMSFAPNQWIKQGAKIATGAETSSHELPTPIRAALAQAEAIESESQLYRRPIV